MCHSRMRVSGGFGVRGPQPIAQSRREHGIRQLHQGTDRPEVLAQILDTPGVAAALRVVHGAAEHVYLRSPESVDRLLHIAHDEGSVRRRIACEQGDDLMLQFVGILVLIDHDELDPGPDPGSGLARAQQVTGSELDVGEVQHRAVALQLPVDLVQLLAGPRHCFGGGHVVRRGIGGCIVGPCDRSRHLLRESCEGLGGATRGAHPLVGSLDAFCNSADTELRHEGRDDAVLRCHHLVEAFEACLPPQCGRVGRIYHRELRVDPGFDRVLPDQSRTERVDCADSSLRAQPAGELPPACGLAGIAPGRPLACSHLRPHPGLHLSCGFLGEGDGHNLIEVCHVRLNQVHVSAHQYPGLA